MNDQTDSETPAAKKPKAKAKPAAKPADKPPVSVRVQVLKNGLTIARGIAAKGRKLTVTQEVAEFHEKRGEVKVLGTA